MCGCCWSHPMQKIAVRMKMTCAFLVMGEEREPDSRRDRRGSQARLAKESTSKKQHVRTTGWKSRSSATEASDQVQAVNT